MHRSWIPFILSVLLLRLCKCILISSNNETNFEYIVELNGSFSRHFSVNSSSSLLKNIHLDNTFYNVSENNRTNLKITEGNDHQQYLVNFTISRVIETSLKTYTIRVSNEENETLGFNVVITRAEKMERCTNQKKHLKLTVKFNQSSKEHVCLLSNTPIKSIVESHFINGTNSGTNAVYKADITNDSSLVLIRDGSNVGQYNVTFFYNSVTSPINNSYTIYNTNHLKLTLHLDVKIEDHLGICSEDKNEKVIFADEETSLNVSFCVFSSSDLLDHVFVNGKIVNLLQTKKDIRIVLKKIEQWKYKFDVFLLIETFNTSNGTMEITVMNKAGLRLHLKVKIKTKGPPVMCEEFSPNLTKTVNIGDNVNATFCVISPNLAPNLQLNDDVYTYNDTRDPTFMISHINNGSRVYHFIYFSIFNVVLKHAKVYTMRLNTIDNKALNLTLDVKLFPDNLQLCENETSQKIIYSNIGDNLTLETCVNVSLHNLLHRLVIDFNGTKLYQSGCQLNFCVLWQPSSMHSTNFTIYIKLYNITYEQFKSYPMYVTTMYNNTDVISVLNYTLDIKLKENCTTDVNVTQTGLDQITLSITLGANLKNQQFTIKAVAVNDSILVLGDIYFTVEEDGAYNIVKTIGGLKYKTEYMINISLSDERKTEFQCHPFIMYQILTGDASYTATSQVLLLVIGLCMALVTLFLVVMTLFMFLVKTKGIVLRRKQVSSRSNLRADIVRRDSHADTDYVNLRNEPDARHYNNISDSVIAARATSDKLLNTDYFKQYPGRYTSNGLIYVTIDHSQTRKKPSHHSSFNKADKVAYVQIDRSKSLNFDSSSTYCNTKSSCDNNLKSCKEFSVDKFGPS